MQLSYGSTSSSKLAESLFACPAIALECADQPEDWRDRYTAGGALARSISPRLTESQSAARNPDVA